MSRQKKHKKAAGALRFRDIKDVWPNPLQGEPRTKPDQRKIIHPKDANPSGNREARRHNTNKAGLPKQSSRANQRGVSKSTKQKLRSLSVLSRRSNRGHRNNQRNNRRV